MRTGRIAMTMQLAPIPPRKVEFTPEACLEVVERWLEKEYKLTQPNPKFCTSKACHGFHSKKLTRKSEPSEIEDDRLLSPLSKRPPSNYNPRLADEILIIQIHSSDPTPRTHIRTTANLTAKVTETSEPWATIAIVRGKDRLEIKDYQTVFPDWGVTAVWPFG